VPPSPDGAEYPFCYRYALAPRSDAFADWQQGRTLASFDWTDLGAFAGEKKLEQVWLALARGQVEVVEPACAPETQFAVRLQVRPPHGRQSPVWGIGEGDLRWGGSARSRPTPTRRSCLKSRHGSRQYFRQIL
jgi:hypothetical protein